MVLSESTYYETLIKLFLDILEVNFRRVAGQTFMFLQQHISDLKTLACHTSIPQEMPIV